MQVKCRPVSFLQISVVNMEFMQHPMHNWRKNYSHFGVCVQTYLKPPLMNRYRLIQVFWVFEQEYKRDNANHKQRGKVKSVSKRK